MEGKERKEKWRRNGTGTAEGQLGERRGFHTQRCTLMVRASEGKGRELQGIWGLEAKAASVSPASSSPGKLVGVLFLNLHPLGSSLTTQVLKLSPPNSPPTPRPFLDFFF